MLPGFVTAYRDNENFVHLYFYQGLKDGKPIYANIDLSKIGQKYTTEKHIDKSVDFKFFEKRIIKLNCKLIFENSGEEIYETLAV